VIQCDADGNAERAVAVDERGEPVLNERGARTRTGRAKTTRRSPRRAGLYSNLISGAGTREHRM